MHSAAPVLPTALCCLSRADSADAAPRAALHPPDQKDALKPCGHGTGQLPRAVSSQCHQWDCNSLHGQGSVPTMIAPAPFVLLNQQQYLLGNLPNPSEEGFSLPMAQLPKASYIRGLVCTMNTSPLIPADTSSTTTGIFFCKHFPK